MITELLPISLEQSYAMIVVTCMGWILGLAALIGEVAWKKYQYFRAMKRSRNKLFSIHYYY